MTFKYPSYCKLLNELGQIDYTIEMNELSLRHFLKELNESSNKQEYLKNKCDTYKIYVGLDNLDELQSRMTLSYIAFVYHAIESFFYEFQDEYNLINDTEWHFKQGTTKLQQILEYFKDRFNKYDKIESYLVDVFDYYHQLRNKFSHKKTVSDKDLAAKFKLAITYKEQMNSIFKTCNSPKEIADLDFEDFFLFTKLAKELCLQISSICIPHPDKIATYLKLNRFKKFINNPERVKKAISLDLLKKFGSDPATSNIFVEEIYKSVMSI